MLSYLQEYIKYLQNVNNTYNEAWTLNFFIQDAKKSQDKIYKITLSTKGAVSIFENVRGATFLFGNFYREALQVKTDVLAQNEVAAADFAGYWIRYDIFNAREIEQIF